MPGAIRPNGDKGNAFRFRKGGFSTNLFDIIATGVFQNLDNFTPQSVGTKIDALLDSDELKALTGAGSNTRKKLEGRVNLGKTWFAS